MAKCLCHCGARYRVPETSVGKKAKCKKCGDVFMLEVADDGPIPIADGYGAGGESREALPIRDVPVAAGPAFDPSTLPPPIIERASTTEDETPRGGYFGDLLSTLLFVKRPANLIIFLVIWFLLCMRGIVLPYAPGIGSLGQWIILGWYCAFRFGVIVEASSGSAQLPEFSWSDGVFDDIIVPFFKWVGSILVVFAPAFVSLLFAAQLGFAAPGTIQSLLAGGASGLVETAATAGAILFAALVLAGMFMWPIVVLCVALGGFATLGAPHLIISTVIRTAPVYLLTLAIVLAAAFLAPLAFALFDGIVASVVAIGIGAYLEIIALRAIGLYYHHFKHRFAWSWG